jgi:hypothetical protein
VSEICGGSNANGSRKLGSFKRESGLFGELSVYLGELVDMLPAACIW